MKTNEQLARELDDIKRDQLLRDEGHTLTSSLRIWASTQRYATVKSFLEARAGRMPARPDDTGRSAAPKDGLQGDELREFLKMTSMSPAEKKEFERVMAGTSVVSDDPDRAGPAMRSDGTFTIRGTSWQWLEQEAERVKARKQ